MLSHPQSFGHTDHAQQQQPHSPQMMATAHAAGAATSVHYVIPENSSELPCSYRQLIRLVLEHNRDGLTLNGIYAHITDRFPYLRTGGPANWRSRVRNTLTVSNDFRRIPDPTGRRSGRWVIAEHHPCPTNVQASQAPTSAHFHQCADMACYSSHHHHKASGASPVMCYMASPNTGAVFMSPQQQPQPVVSPQQGMSPATVRRSATQPAVHRASLTPEVVRARHQSQHPARNSIVGYVNNNATNNNVRKMRAFSYPSLDMYYEMDLSGGEGSQASSPVLAEPASAPQHAQMFSYPALPVTQQSIASLEHTFGGLVPVANGSTASSPIASTTSSGGNNIFEAIARDFSHSNALSGHGSIHSSPDTAMARKEVMHQRAFPAAPVANNTTFAQARRHTVVGSPSSSVAYPTAVPTGAVTGSSYHTGGSAATAAAAILSPIHEPSAAASMSICFEDLLLEHSGHGENNNAPFNFTAAVEASAISPAAAKAMVGHHSLPAGADKAFSEFASISLESITKIAQELMFGHQ